MHKKITLFTLLIITALSCSHFHLQLPENKSLDGWHTAGGSPTQNNFRESGPTPPLELIETVSFSAAPAQNLVAIENTILIGTKNGRIFPYHLQNGRGKGKIKLPENIAGNLGLHESGLLVVGLAIGRETLLCYDLRSGDLKWKQRAGLLFGEPVVADSSVYLVARFKHVDRYNIHNGKRIWRFDLESQAHTAPAVSEKLVVFGTDGGDIYALDRKTGLKMWQQKADAAIFASPVIDDECVFVGATDSTLRAFNLDSGALIWTFKASARIRRTPALFENTLVVATGDGEVFGLETSHGKVTWKYRATSGIGTSPLIVNKTVYFGGLDKNLYALDLHSGKLLWKTELRGRVRTNPIAIDEYLIVGSEDKFVYIFKGKTSGEAD